MRAVAATAALAAGAHAASLKWTLQTGGGVQTAPAVSDYTIYAGSNDGYLYSMSKSSGKLNWQFKTGAGVKSSPVLWNGMVFVGSDDHQMYAIDAATGSERWHYSAGGPIYGTPVIDHGAAMLYFGSDYFCYCLDANTGGERWKFVVGSSIYSSPALEGSGLGARVFIGSDDRHVYALNATYGFINNKQEIWKVSTGAIVHGSPQVYQGTVYVGSDNGVLYALDTATGGQKWTYGCGDSIMTRPAVSGGKVFVSSYDQNLHAVDAATGGQVWKVEIANSYDVMSSPTVDGDTIYIGSPRSHLYAINANNGQVKWTFALEGEVYSTPVLSEGDVFVGSMGTSAVKGKVWRISPSGSPPAPTPAPPAGPPPAPMTVAPPGSPQVCVACKYVEGEICCNPTQNQMCYVGSNVFGCCDCGGDACQCYTP